MSDIVERLRQCVSHPEKPSIAWEAAAEIESLRAERTLIVARAENAERALEEADERHRRYIKAVEELAARAAEADALLVEARDALPTLSLYESRIEYLKGLRDRIDAHLSRKEPQ